jgi:hypothetical protein
MHVAIVDQPGFLIGVTIAAAGEGGHRPIETPIGAAGKPLGVGVFPRPATTTRWCRRGHESVPRAD